MKKITLPELYRSLRVKGSPYLVEYKQEGIWYEIRTVLYGKIITSQKGMLNPKTQEILY